MKLASLLGGVAALALSAAPALAEGNIYKGATTQTWNLGLLGSYTGTIKTGESAFFGLINGTAAVIAADIANPGLTSNTAVFTIDSDGFAANSGTMDSQAGATFSMTGNVGIECAYYTGGTNTDIAFGTIGINAQGNNPNLAFEMVGGDRTVEIDSNLAGCNTKNTVKFSKTDLSNTTNQGGFDGAQFTNVIPVTLVAKFVAGGEGATSNATEKTVMLSNTGAQAAESTYGAWKSYLNIDLTLTNPNKGLLAGNYAGSVSVEIKAAAL